MGFSLKQFFDELQDMLDNAFTEEDVDAIVEFVDEQREYAEQCGQLR